MSSTSAKIWNIVLWIVQLLLAATLLWAVSAKWLKPAAELAAMWPWTAQVPRNFVLFTGLVDLLGAFGLVLPALLRIRPGLTPAAAVGVVLLMICASVFHISRGEASLIGINIVFALLAALVAWGRLSRAPIAPRN